MYPYSASIGQSSADINLKRNGRVTIYLIIVASVFRNTVRGDVTFPSIRDVQLLNDLNMSSTSNDLVKLTFAPPLHSFVQFHWCLLLLYAISFGFVFGR